MSGVLSVGKRPGQRTGSVHDDAMDDDVNRVVLGSSAGVRRVPADAAIASRSSCGDRNMCFGNHVFVHRNCQETIRIEIDDSLMLQIRSIVLKLGRYRNVHSLVISREWPH